ncbi:MAG: hypothetical protein COV45_02425 [Deltaproteobacteria bacterium CG11_big_fil_rev_8_21_14_0_20_47_16]|nr:MAG: hypothetical protein COV45_02425 [Deltaproteobacteria bacterium CG11_big_fil_rev_8_21_14_0_20_47_16]
MNRLLLLIVAFTISACGDGMLYTNVDKDPQIFTSESTELGSATITKDAFLFASPYPARIIIPDIDSMRSTAFVVSTLNPSGVVAIDLDSRPYSISTKFKGVTSPPGTGLPNNLIIQSPTRAFMLTSSHVIDFNPTTGDVRAAVALPKSVKLDSSLPLSGPLDFDNDGNVDTTTNEIHVAFPGGIAITNDTLWVSTANYLRYAPPAVAAPGTVFRYTITETGLVAAPQPTIITSGYNPTGITNVGNGTVLITNSGVLNIIDGEASPETPSSVDIVNATTGALTSSLPMGKSSLSFFAPRIDPTGQFAYFGSTAFPHVYQLDLLQNQWIRDLSNPITINSSISNDYLTAVAITPDGERAFVGSFDQSSVFILDLTSNPVTPFPTSWPVGFSKGVTPDNPSGVNTGISDIAIRPGIAGTDFTGPDVFALTGNPGSMVTINTYSGAPQKIPPLRSVEIRPAFVPLGVGNQSYVSGLVTLGTGKQLINITTHFTHPDTQQIYTLHWHSDNPAIATVSADGLVTGISTGITKITVSVGGVSAQTTVAIHTGAVPNISSAPTTETPEDNGKLVVVNCKDIGAIPFVNQIVSYVVGSGGGANENNLPQVIQGPPQGGSVIMGSTDTFSLGDKGQIIVAFNHCPIADGPGTDFIVFENAFYAGGNPNAVFSEPAIVGVSMDGVNFTDFPCDLNNSPNYPGCAGTHPVLSNPTNGVDPLDPQTAGGDPFDLAAIGVQKVKFIRIIDQGLTPFKGINGTNGFDLDAIAVVHGSKP